MVEGPLLEEFSVAVAGTDCAAGDCIAVGSVPSDDEPDVPQAVRSSPRAINENRPTIEALMPKLPDYAM
jgi:hypothetical protein